MCNTAVGVDREVGKGFSWTTIITQINKWLDWSGAKITKKRKLITNIEGEVEWWGTYSFEKIEWRI